MFWDNFKKICDEKGLKPTPVLKECGISTGSIGRWQKGASPYADAVLTIAEYLNCSTDVLYKVWRKAGKQRRIKNAGDVPVSAGGFTGIYLRFHRSGIRKGN